MIPWIQQLYLCCAGYFLIICSYTGSFLLYLRFITQPRFWKLLLQTTNNHSSYTWHYNWSCYYICLLILDGFNKFHFICYISYYSSYDIWKDLCWVSYKIYNKFRESQAQINLDICVIKNYKQYHCQSNC